MGAERLEGILAELTRIQEELNRLPEDAFEERARLKDRQSELRAQAARLREEEGAAPSS